ncbi:hypothetical protein V7S43_018686 [Phytophthora oleae]|uniref:Uncharacterized protein n=1 Tax=Phytophthora oleae TaxID=2107226 RepID=A0ABD3EQI7_9STRA
MGPNASMAFLRELLALHEPAYDEFTVGEACNLCCAATKNGHYVWVNALEMEKMKEHLDPCEPEPMPPIKIMPPIEPMPAPSSLESVSFAITGMSGSNDAGCLPIVANTYYCEWEIVRSSSSQGIGGRKTDRFIWLDTDVSMKETLELLDLVDSIEMLRNCMVKVYLKKGRRLTGRIRSDKELGSGQELLTTHIATDCCTSQTVHIPITVNSGKLSHTVTCELAIKFST